MWFYLIFWRYAPNVIILHSTLPISEFKNSITAFRISKTSSFCLQPLNGLIEPKQPLVFSLTTDECHSPGFINPFLSSQLANLNGTVCLCQVIVKSNTCFFRSAFSSLLSARIEIKRIRHLEVKIPNVFSITRRPLDWW